MIHTGIVDVFHGDADTVIAKHGTLISALTLAKQSGVTTLILKDGEGLGYTDPRAAAWYDAAKTVGLDVGLYYFGTDSAPGDRQCAECLADIRNLLGSEAALLAALMFYANTDTLSHIHDPGPLAALDVWAARYGGNLFPVLGPQWTRGTFLWQYEGAESSGTEFPSDAATYPRVTPGLGQVDRSAFAGDATAFRAAWGNGIRLALDFEHNPGHGGDMTLENAKLFAETYAQHFGP